MIADKIAELQPNVPVVYAEPVKFEDFKFEREAAKVIDFVNEEADKQRQEKLEEEFRARVERRSRTIAALITAVVAFITFFSAVGITTVYHWILG